MKVDTFAPLGLGKLTAMYLFSRCLPLQECAFIVLNSISLSNREGVKNSGGKAGLVPVR